MPRSIRSMLLASAMTALLTPGAVQAEEYSNFLVFGDSLADSGQLPDPARFLGILPNLPEDARLRFTNRLGDGQYGAPYTDALAERLGFAPPAPSQPVDITEAEAGALGLRSAVASATGLNYAVGGQTASEVRSSIDGSENATGTGAISRASIVGLPSLFDAVPANDAFAQDGIAPAFLDGANAGSVEGAVAVISAGGNDIRRVANVAIALTGDYGGAGFVTDEAAIATGMQDAAAQTVAAAQALADAGAGLVIVPNLPDLGAIPENPVDVGFALQQLAAHRASLESGGSGTLSAQQLADLEPLVQVVGAALMGGASNDEAALAAISWFNGLRSQASTSYNDALSAGLAGIDGNVMAVDLRSFFDAVTASPAAFGFSPAIDHRTTCYNGQEATAIACIEDAALGFNSGTDANGDGVNDAANPLAFVFNDGIHPTTAAHERTAEYIHGMLIGADAVAVAPFLGIGAGRSVAATAMDQARARGRLPGIAPFVALTARAADYGETGESASQDALFAGGLGGVSYGMGNGIVAGAGLGVQYLSAETGGGQADMDGLGYFGVLFAGVDRGLFFGRASLTGGFLDLDIDRSTRIGPSAFANQGSTDGSVFGAEIEAGVRAYDTGTMALGPVARLGFWTSDLDGYTETGNGFTALRFGDGGARSTRGAIGGFLETESAVSGLPVHFRAELLYAHEFDGEGDDVSAAQASLGGGSFTRPGREGGESGFVIDLELGVGVGPGELGLGYAAALFDDEDEHGVQLSYRLPL